eukprot:1265210-Rhodomonas_salina.2
MADSPVNPLSPGQESPSLPPSLYQFFVLVWSVSSLLRPPHPSARTAAELVQPNTAVENPTRPILPKRRSDTSYQSPTIHLQPADPAIFEVGFCTHSSANSVWIVDLTATRWLGSGFGRVQNRLGSVSDMIAADVYGLEHPSVQCRLHDDDLLSVSLLHPDPRFFHVKVWRMRKCVGLWC